MTDPEQKMSRALALAAQGRYTTQPNPRVGCIIVQNGSIVGEGFHQRAGEAHAEVIALRAAGERARGADVYVTLEPCCHHGRTPPCVEALITAGVRKVWIAMQDPNPQVAGQGIAALRGAGIEVEAGLMQQEAQLLNRGFISRMQRGRPWVTLKLAASFDGRTAMASGESRWITGEDARADVHRLRAEAGAVMTGSATVLADNPELTVRGTNLSELPDEILVRLPDRIVLDTRAMVPANAKVWAAGARRFWITGAPGGAPPGVERLMLSPERDGHVGLAAALTLLAQREINHLLVECGPHLAGAILRQGIADEVVLYLAPHLLGSDARPLAHLPGLHTLEQKIRLEWLDVRKIGSDLRLTARPAPLV